MVDEFGNAIPRPGVSPEDVAAQAALVKRAHTNFINETLKPAAYIAGFANPIVALPFIAADAKALYDQGGAGNVVKEFTGYTALRNATQNPEEFGRRFYEKPLTTAAEFVPAVLLAKGVYSGIRGRAVPRETAKGVKPAEEVAPKTRPEQAAATPQDRSEIRAIFEKSNELTAVIDEGYKVRPVQKIVKTGELDQVEIQAMKQKTGMDLAGYSREITSEKIRHAVKKHGGSAEAARGQLPLTRNDFLKVPEIARAENVVKVDVGKRQQPLIIYEKPVNGYLYVVEEVLTGKKTLQFLSMRKLKRSSARPNAGEPGPVSHVQDVRSLTSTSNIYKSEGKVNGNPDRSPPST